MRSGLIIYFLLDLYLFAQVSETTTPCDCKSEFELLSWIKSGTIPELFLADFNIGSYQNWSSSVLCPGGNPPAYVSDEEDDLGLVQLNYAEWSCKYSAFSAMDNDPKTAWCEGVDGAGIGEILLVQINTHKDLYIWSGYGKSEKLFKANNRPRKIKLYYLQTSELPEAVQTGIGFSNIKLVETIDFELKDQNGYQSIPSVTANADEGEFTATFLAVEIVSVYKGTIYDDTCISEISNDFNQKKNNIQKK
nr:hypothetical protein [uncultured Sphaerochaeta sp.]